MDLIHYVLEADHLGDNHQLPRYCCRYVVNTGVSFVYSLFHSLALTEGPVSVSALVGENALFHCTGSGFTIAWIVDGSLATDTSITDRGITENAVSSSGSIQSTLTVPATSVNNGTTVQCRIVSHSGFAISNNATLTVLPGELCWTDTID